MFHIKDTQDKFAWKVNIMFTKNTCEKAESTCLHFLEAFRRQELMRYGGAHAAVVLKDARLQVKDANHNTEVTHI